MPSPASSGQNDLQGPSSSASHTVNPAYQSFWLWVLCLTGVGYFGTLAYQPSIAITLCAADAAKHLIEGENKGVRSH